MWPVFGQWFSFRTGQQRTSSPGSGSNYNLQISGVRVTGHTPALPAPGTVDQKKPLQSASSKMYGRMRMSNRVQFRTVWHCFCVEQPESAHWTSFSTACGATTCKNVYGCEVGNSADSFCCQQQTISSFFQSRSSLKNIIPTLTKVTGVWGRG